MTTQYYNAKPSQVGNLGADVHGARRMHYDTYESGHEKQKRIAKSKEQKRLKDALKTAVLSAEPSPMLIVGLLSELFENRYGFCPSDTFANDEIETRRSHVLANRTNEAVSEFNSMVRAYNKVRTQIHRLESNYWQSTVKALAKPYQAKKKAVVEQTGKRFLWSSGKITSDTTDCVEYLARNTKAVQFGNSVPDNERAYVLSNLRDFLTAWDETKLRSKPLTELSWSFGARGKANSVAYYKPSQRLISVNRNKIGSLVHEVGHYIDYTNGMPSNKIPNQYIAEYRESLKAQGLSHEELRYYCSRVEIFARAFEAYCYEQRFSFEEFAQCGKAYLPVLNDEIRNIIECVF